MKWNFNRGLVSKVWFVVIKAAFIYAITSNIRSYGYAGRKQQRLHCQKSEDVSCSLSRKWKGPLTWRRGPTRIANIRALILMLKRNEWKKLVDDFSSIRNQTINWLFPFLMKYLLKKAQNGETFLFYHKRPHKTTTGRSRPC